MALPFFGASSARQPDQPVDVFISYSRKDAKTAAALEALLKSNGKSVWRDKSRLKPGESVAHVIPAALRDARTVVTIWSADSVGSDWVKYETSYALIEGKSAALSILPFDHGRLPSMFRDIHCSDLAATLANPDLLLARLAEISDPVKRRHASRIDVSRMPATYASRLFGREQEMADLFKAWHSPDTSTTASNKTGAGKTNIVVLDAMGGTGKTALVSHFIGGMRDRGWLGAQAVFVWSFYSQGTDEKRQGSAEQFLAKALEWFGHGGSPLPTQHDKGVRLAELVASRRTLLILDGLEPLQYAAGRAGGGHGPRGIAGALKEAGLAALFKQLAVDNPGLMIVTSRLKIPDLQTYTEPAVVTQRLERIATKPGVELLRTLGVVGPPNELEKAVEDFRGHALALTILGHYLADHYNGDVKRRDTVPSLMGQDDLRDRDPRRVMMAYETQLRRQIEDQAKKGQRPAETAAAKQLAFLYIVGLFDRPVERAAIDVLLAPPEIPGLTEGMAGLSRAQWDTAANALRKLGLLAPEAAQSGGDNGGGGSGGEIDAHPLVREYFGGSLEQTNPAAWKAAHARLWRHYEAAGGGTEATSVEQLSTSVHAITHATLSGNPGAAVDLYDKRIKGRVNAWGLYAFDISVLLNFFDEPWRRLAPGIAETKQSQLLAQVQGSLRSSGRLAEATEAIEHNCTLLKAQQKWRVYVDQRVELMQILIKLGRLDRAIKEGIDALALADQHEVISQRADILCFLGHAHHMRGDLVAAKAAFKGSIDATKHKEEHRRLSSFRQFAMNEFYLDRGSKKVVRKWTTLTLAIAKKEMAKRGVRAAALDQLSLGRLSLLEAEAQSAPDLRQKFFEQAEQLIDESLIGLRNNKELDELPRALILRAALHRKLGRFAQAHKHIGEALNIAEHFSMPLMYVDGCLEAVRLNLANGDPHGAVAAAEYLDRAEKLMNETKYERRRAQLFEIKVQVDAAMAMPSVAAAAPAKATPEPSVVPNAAPGFFARIVGAFRGGTNPSPPPRV